MMSASRSKQLVNRREDDDDDDDDGDDEEEEVQRLRDEVLYLHSLWHQGPPPKPSLSISIPSHSSPSKSKSKSKTKPKPYQSSSSSSAILHLVSKPQPFKTTKKPTPTLQVQVQVHDPIVVTSSSLAGLVQWPCPSQSPSTSSASASASAWPSWHSPIITPPQQPPLPLATLPSTSIALQLQRQFVQESRKFLTAPSNSTQEGDDDDDEDDDDDANCDPPMAEQDQSPEFKFFSKLFEEEEGKELRDYYENHRESGGDLCCLVCGGIGKKGWKRFSSCLALLQHALTVSNTKKKRAHRAFGQVICKVLGLDVARFPAIVLHPQQGQHQQKQPGDPNTSILQQSGLNDDAKPSNEVSNLTINNSESVPANDEKLVAEEDSRLHPNTAMLAQSSSHQDNAGKCASSVHKERSISKKAEAVGCNTNFEIDGRSYKKQNVEFWVNNHCWPEERLNASMLRSCSQKKASESDLTEDHIPN